METLRSGIRGPSSPFDSSKWLLSMKSLNFSHNDIFRSETQATMSEEHFDEFEHYNFDQDKAMRSGHSGESQ